MNTMFGFACVPISLTPRLAGHDQRPRLTLPGQHQAVITRAGGK
jgi:hypothetical protein